MFTSLSVLHCHSQNLEMKKKTMCGKSINIHSTYISQIMYTQKLINWWWILCLRNLKLAHYTHATFARLWIVASICFVLFCFFLVFEKLIFILENVENDMVKPSVSNKAQLYKVANTIWHLCWRSIGKELHSKWNPLGHTVKLQIMLLYAIKNNLVI